MKPAPFDYVVARDAADAVALLARYGEDARLLAGGQSLVPMMNFRLARPSTLIDLARCRDLDYIRVETDGLHIGAMTRQRVAQESALVRSHCPLVSRALAMAGPVTVRNRGTVGGSLSNGYPLAHLPCAAVCLSARMVLQSRDGMRTLAARDFFVDALVTDIRPGEVLRECVFPCLRATDRVLLRQVGNHRGGAASCLVAMHAACTAAGELAALSIAVSGVAPVPIRLEQVERSACGSETKVALREAFDIDLVAAGVHSGNAGVADVAALAWQLVEDGLFALREVHS